jgi:hypothetical protein
MSVVFPLKSKAPRSSVREDSFFQFVARATDDELLIFLEQGFPLITAMASYRSTKKKDVIEVREANVVERKPRFASSRARGTATETVRGRTGRTRRAKAGAIVHVPADRWGSGLAVVDHCDGTVLWRVENKLDRVGSF